MKVLIIQEAGRNKENASFRECFAIQRAFEQNGHTADIWGLNHPSYINVVDFESYDMLFILENYSFFWLPDFSKIKKPIKVQWIIDLHCGDHRYIPLSRQMDVVLHSTRSLMSDYKFKCPNQQHIWFPNGVDDRVFYKRSLPKDSDICFVASPHAGRRELAQYVGAKFYTLLGEEMVRKVSSSRAHFNQSLGCDVNYRCWETVALGTALISNFVPEMQDVGFIHGSNCLLYADHYEAREYVSYLSEYPKVAEQLAEKGLILAAKNSYTERVASLLKSLKF